MNEEKFKNCSICKDKISIDDPEYFINIGKAKLWGVIPINTRKGTLCYSCFNKIDEFLQRIKK